MDLTPIDDFRKSHQVNTKGALAAAIQLNRFFSADTLPIDASDYHTNKEGQVKGISKDNCQKSLPNMASHDSSQQRADEPAAAPWH